MGEEASRAYEQAVMAAKPGEDPGVEPPEDYVMSEAFQAWLVQRMRDEVFGEDGGIALVSADKLAKAILDEVPEDD